MSGVSRSLDPVDGAPGRSFTCSSDLSSDLVGGFRGVSRFGFAFFGKDIVEAFSHLDLSRLEVVCFVNCLLCVTLLW